MGILSYLKRVAFGEAVIIDEAVNVLLPDGVDSVPAAGNAHWTVSQRLAQMRLRGSRTGCVGCAILTAIFAMWIDKYKLPYDHCFSALSGFPDNLPTGG